jgi:hypothetical protein
MRAIGLGGARRIRSRQFVSLQPTGQVLSSNTQAPTVMIAEKGVDLITGRERYSSMQNTSGSARPRPTSATAVQATNATNPQRNPGNSMNRED